MKDHIVGRLTSEPLLEHISDRFLNQCIPVFQFGVQGKNEGHMWKYLSCVVAVHTFGNGTRGGLNWFLCFSVDYRPIVVTAVDSCERRRHGWDRLASQARFSDQREKLNRLKGGFLARFSIFSSLAPVSPFVRFWFSLLPGHWALVLILQMD